MALTQALCTSFKVELMQALHDFTPGTGDVFKLALFRDTALIVGAFGAGTTNYSDMGADEVNGVGYTAGGEVLTGSAPTSAGTTAFVDFDDVVFSNATFAARGGLIYNETQGGRAVAVMDFGSDKTVTGVDFTVVFPAATASTAIIRLV